LLTVALSDCEPEPEIDAVINELLLPIRLDVGKPDRLLLRLEESDGDCDAETEPLPDRLLL